MDTFHTSDERRKYDIVPLREDEASHIMMVDIIKYKWKKNDKNSVGVSAQQTSTIYPDTVTLDGNQYLTVNYNGLLCNLIKHVQALTKRVEELESDKRTKS